MGLGVKGPGLKGRHLTGLQDGLVGVGQDLVVDLVVGDGAVLLPQVETQLALVADVQVTLLTLGERGRGGERAMSWHHNGVDGCKQTNYLFRHGTTVCIARGQTQEVCVPACICVSVCTRMCVSNQIKLYSSNAQKYHRCRPYQEILTLKSLTNNAVLCKV